jgi:hypothetical protein
MQIAHRKKTSAKVLLFQLYFLWLGERGAHRQQQAGSTGLTVLLQIQTDSFGAPPNSSASDLTFELDQY